MIDRIIKKPTVELEHKFTNDFVREMTAERTKTYKKDFVKDFAKRLLNFTCSYLVFVVVLASLFTSVTDLSLVGFAQNTALYLPAVWLWVVLFAFEMLNIGLRFPTETNTRIMLEELRNATLASRGRLFA